MRSVYVHIPFCNSICSYCDFCKMLYNEEWVDHYLSKLEIEINKYYENDVVKTIYIGGGTPSSLSINFLERLFSMLSNIKIYDKNEYTIEMNVNDITEDKLILLKKYKINRVSVGIESFNKFKLKFMNRKHNKKEIIKAIKLLRKYDFDNINIDFMYALPIENYKIFKKDLKKFLHLDVEHISTYSLIIEDNTALKINDIKPLDENLDAKMYKYLTRKLKKYDFNHYEVSNFSKTGYESIHNLTYWNNEEYYGFGLGSHGFINNVRYENTRNLNKYLNEDFRKEEYIVSTKEDMENEVIFGLRKLSGIDIKKFYDKFGKNIQEVFDIKAPFKNKYLILEGNYLKIPEDKIYLMNEILGMMLK